MALVASAYTQNSTMYSSSSLLRTMELILGLPPLTQFDAAATPMWASFQATPDLRPYKVRMALVPLDERNSASAFGARRSMQLVLDEADAAPDDELNEILWKAIKGRDSPMPPGKWRRLSPAGNCATLTFKDDFSQGGIMVHTHTRRAWCLDFTADNSNCRRKIALR